MSPGTLNTRCIVYWSVEPNKSPPDPLGLKYADSLAGQLAVSFEIYSLSLQPRMLPELQKVFPGADLTAETLIIPTFQPCQCDLVANGPEPDAEKDRLLLTFMEYAKKVCASLREQGYWADLTDPCSGLPVLGERGGSWYPDVIGSQMLLNYDMIDTGCCKLISHPKWQTKVYPATLFAVAPLETVTPLLQK